MGAEGPAAQEPPTAEQRLGGTPHDRAAASRCPHASAQHGVFWIIPPLVPRTLTKYLYGFGTEAELAACKMKWMVITPPASGGGERVMLVPSDAGVSWPGTSSEKAGQEEGGWKWALVRGPSQEWAVSLSVRNRAPGALLVSWGWGHSLAGVPPAPAKLSFLQRWQSGPGLCWALGSTGCPPPEVGEPSYSAQSWHTAGTQLVLNKRTQGGLMRRPTKPTLLSQLSSGSGPLLPWPHPSPCPHGSLHSSNINGFFVWGELFTGLLCM